MSFALSPGIGGSRRTTSPWWHYRGLHDRRTPRLYLLADLARATFPTVAKALRPTPAHRTVRRPHEKLRPTLSRLACTQTKAVGPSFASSRASRLRRSIALSCVSGGPPP